MQKIYLFILLVLAAPLAAMAQPSVQVQVSTGNNYGWHGPDWYYGHYFFTESDYIAWMEGRYPYSGGTYQTVIWVGPGWYGGYWYGNRRDWEVHYQHNTYNRYYNRRDHRNWQNRDNQGDRGDGNRGDRGNRGDGNRGDRGGGNRGRGR